MTENNERTHKPMSTHPRQLTYREGSVADAEQMMEVALVSYGKYEKVLSHEGWQTMKTNMMNRGRMEDLIRQSTPFVCCDGDTIAGMAFLVPHGNPYFAFEADWSYIRMVGVRPEYKGRGIARTLTSKCISLARQTGEHIIALHTSEMMDAARHIYESIGFTQLREIDPIFGKRYWLYTLNLK